MGSLTNKGKLYISELLKDEELEELICSYQLGLELIQFSIADNLDKLDETLDHVKVRLHRFGDPELTIHGPFLDLNPMAYDRQVRQVTMRRFEDAYLAAKELGAKKIIYHSGMIPSVYMLTGWAERMIDFWNEFLNQHTEIMVCMENVLDQEIMPVLQTAESIRKNNFGLCLDIGHAHCYSYHSEKEWAEKLLPYIQHVHLHDNSGGRDQHLGIGDGTVMWDDVFEVLQHRNSISYVIECAEKQAVERSLAFLKENKKASGL